MKLFLIFVVLIIHSVIPQKTNNAPKVDTPSSAGMGDKLSIGGATTFKIMEEWKVVPQYPYYEVSNLGRVRNVKTGRVLKPFDRNRGYSSVQKGG